MRLLQRVMTLIRANINELVERADDPETAMKQIILDLNNQVIQVKTSMAQSLADQHLLENRLAALRQEAAACEQQAKLAVDRNDDTVARLALQRLNSSQRTINDIETQLCEQSREAEALKLALAQLELKITEVSREHELLLARQRRASAREKLAQSRTDIQPERIEQLLDAITGYVDRAEGGAEAIEQLNGRAELLELEENEKLEQQLANLKAGRRSGKSK